MENLPNQIIFSAPDLPAGTYQLQVRATIKDGNELRQGILPATLTVA